jgi:antitoxin component of MazEF toxin-antitoxin module
MPKRIIRLEDAASVSLPPEAVDALGVNAGDKLDIEIVGRALVVRSADDARRSREFADIFESVLKKRRRAYEQLAKGPAWLSEQ